MMTPLSFSLVTDPDQVAALARANQAAHWAWHDQHREDPNLAVTLDRVTQQVMAGIDCTTCGRCCQHMGPEVSEAEIAQLADGLQLTPAQIRTRFLQPMWPGAADHEQIWLLLRAGACPLHDGRLCTVYEHRPQICRDFPQAAGPTPAARLGLFVETARLCPITYNVLVILMSEE